MPNSSIPATGLHYSASDANMTTKSTPTSTKSSAATTATSKSNHKTTGTTKAGASSTRTYEVDGGNKTASKTMKKNNNNPANKAMMENASSEPPKDQGQKHSTSLVQWRPKLRPNVSSEWLSKIKKKSIEAFKEKEGEKATNKLQK